jgi:hypothetical protein
MLLTSIIDPMPDTLRRHRRATSPETDYRFRGTHLTEHIGLQASGADAVRNNFLRWFGEYEGAIGLESRELNVAMPSTERFQCRKIQMAIRPSRTAVARHVWLSDHEDTAEFALTAFERWRRGSPNNHQQIQQVSLDGHRLPAN